MENELLLLCFHVEKKTIVLLSKIVLNMKHILQSIDFTKLIGAEMLFQQKDLIHL